MNAAYLYVRVNTDEQKRKDYSLPEQENSCLIKCLRSIYDFKNNF